MMNGNFGVFDHTTLVAEFVTDEDAGAHMRALQEGGFFVPEYEDGMFVARVPDNYVLWNRLLVALRKSRNKDRALQREEASRGA